ncbi:hypothetical protein D3C85_1943170 [compost metagenome]
MIEPQAPPGLAFMSLMACLQPSITLVRLTASTWFQASRSSSSTLLRKATPALLTSTSRRP